MTNEERAAYCIAQAVELEAGFPPARQFDGLTTAAEALAQMWRGMAAKLQAAA